MQQRFGKELILEENYREESKYLLLKVRVGHSPPLKLLMRSQMSIR